MSTVKRVEPGPGKYPWVTGSEFMLSSGFQWQIQFFFVNERTKMEFGTPEVLVVTLQN